MAMPLYLIGIPLVWNKQLFRQAGLNPNVGPSTWAYAGSDVGNPDNCLHAVLPARSDFDSGIEHIAGLGAEHLRPLVITEIRHFLGLVGPRVPNDCCKRVLFVDVDAPTQHRVVYSTLPRVLR